MILRENSQNILEILQQRSCCTMGWMLNKSLPHISFHLLVSFITADDQQQVIT